MALSAGDVQVLLQLKDALTPALALVSKAVQGFESSATKTFQNVAGSLGAAIGVQTLSIAGLTAAVAELGSHGADVDDVARNFDLLTTASGGAKASLDTLRTATDGTISDFDLMKISNQGFSQGLSLSQDQMKTTGEAARVLADRIGGSTTEAYDKLTEAMATGVDRQLKTVGVNIDAAAAVDKYAASVGKAKDALTEDEQIQAKRAAIMDALSKVVQESGRSQTDFGDRIEQSKVLMTNFTDALGVAISKSPVLEAGMSAAGRAMEEAFGKNQTSTVKTLVDGIGKGAIVLAQFGQVAIEAARFVTNAFHLVDYAFNATLGGLSSGVSMVAGKLLSLAEAGKDLPEFMVPGIEKLIPALRDVTNGAEGAAKSFKDSKDAALDSAAKSNAAFDSTGKALAQVASAMEVAGKTANDTLPQTAEQAAAAAAGINQAAVAATAKATADKLAKLASDAHTKAMLEAQDAARKQAEEFQKLVLAYRTSSTNSGIAAEHLKQVSVVLQGMGPVANASSSDLARATLQLKGLGDEGRAAADKLTASFAKVQGVVLPLGQKFTDLIAPTSTVSDGWITGAEAANQVAKSIDELNASSHNQLAVEDALHAAYMAGKITLEQYDKLLGDTKTKTDDVATAAQRAAAAVQNIGGIGKGLLSVMDALGVSSDNAFGAMLGGLSAGADGAASLGKSLQNADGSLKDIKDINFGNLLQSIGGIVSGFKKVTDSASGMQRGMGGAAMGAQIGGQFAGAYGAAIGAVVGFVAGVFAKPSWVKVGEEAGKTLGVAIGQALAKEIEKTAKDLKIDVASAALLHIGEAADQAGVKISTMTDQVIALMVGVGNGSIPAKEGIDAITDAFGRMTDEALTGSTAAVEGLTTMNAELVAMVWKGAIPAAQAVHLLGDEFDKLKTAAEAGDQAAQSMMTTLIQQARQAGLVIPEVAAYVKDQLSKVAASLPDIFKNLHLGAKDEAILFSATFWATVKEQGLFAAIDALKPAWDEFKKQLKNLGADAKAALGVIPDLMNLASGATAGIISGLTAAQQALDGLANSGYLSQDAFHALEDAAQKAYNQLIAAGVAPQTALMAIAPLLGDLQNKAAQYGLTLDDNTKKLIGQASAAGAAFAPDPQQMMIQLLGQIVTLMGGTLPAAMNTFTDSTQTGLQTTTTAWGLAGGQITDTITGVASNGVTQFQTLADSAGNSGDYVGVIWAQNIDEIPYHVDHNTPLVGDAFDAMADASLDPLHKLATAVGDIDDGLKRIRDDAKKAGDAINGLPTETGGGGSTTGDGGDGGHQHAPHHAFGTITTGPEYALIGERGPEVVAPVAALMSQAIAAGLAAARSGESGGGGTIVLHNNVQLDGRQMAAWNSQASRRRTMRISPGAVRRF